MKYSIEEWTVAELLKEWDCIDSQPTYQRGPVWSARKRALLIDSMLRGMEMPKLFFRKLEGKAHDYEVADGQQRLMAIKKFADDKLHLLADSEKGLDLNFIDGEKVGGLSYSSLPKGLQTSFDKYRLTVSIITTAKPAEIRTLFGRLQAGVTLNPAEKRNAILSPIADHVNSLTAHHDFFCKSKIDDKRFKRQDFMAHAITLVAYGNQGALKADAIERLYLDKTYRLTQPVLKRIAVTLDVLHEIDKACSLRIKRKFHFIDFFWFVYRSSAPKSIDAKKVAKAFDAFEAQRRKYHSDPKLLLTKGNQSKQHRLLYDYIIAFKTDGSAKSSIDTRALVFNELF